MVLGLTCVMPHGVATPGKVFPNPCSALAICVFVVAPINGFTYSDKRFPPRACAPKDHTTAMVSTPACFKFIFISMIFRMIFK